eukprot:2981222-Rhodomonas_salina.1
MVRMWLRFAGALQLGQNFFSPNHLVMQLLPKTCPQARLTMRCSPLLDQASRQIIHCMSSSRFLLPASWSALHASGAPPLR